MKKLAATKKIVIIFKKNAKSKVTLQIKIKKKIYVCQRKKNCIITSINFL